MIFSVSHPIEPPVWHAAALTRIQSAWLSPAKQGIALTTAAPRNAFVEVFMLQILLPPCDGQRRNLSRARVHFSDFAGEPMATQKVGNSSACR
jgi:hypothetical protein